jgi:hypothetical protein
MYEQLLQPSLLRFFRITALDSLLSHKGLTVSSALFCEKISRKSGQSKLLVQVLRFHVLQCANQKLAQISIAEKSSVCRDLSLRRRA